MSRRPMKSIAERVRRIGPGLRTSGQMLYSPTPNSDQIPGLTETLEALQEAIDELEDQLANGILPRDTYEDEVFVIPEFRQLVLVNELNLIGTASIDNQGTLAVL